MGNLYDIKLDIWETITSILPLDKAIIAVIVPRLLDMKFSSSNHNIWNWEEEAFIIIFVITVCYSVILKSLCSFTKGCLIVVKRSFFQNFTNMVSNRYKHLWWILSFVVVSIWVRGCSELPANHFTFVCNSLRFAGLNHIYIYIYFVQWGRDKYTLKPWLSQLSACHISTSRVCYGW